LGFKVQNKESRVGDLIFVQIMNLDMAFWGLAPGLWGFGFTICCFVAGSRRGAYEVLSDPAWALRAFRVEGLVFMQSGFALQSGPSKCRFVRSSLLAG